jgi:RsiW-degrading membrane proteinase PrsW (M82 family)
MEEWLGASPSPNLWETMVYSFCVIAAWEELAKFLFLRFYMYRKDVFNEPFDGIVYGVMIGMGFASFENIFYVLDGDWRTALVRMFTAVPAHALFGVIMGYYVGRAKFDPSHLKGLTFKGLIIPILIHGTYDFFLFQESIPLLGLGALVSLVIGIRYAKIMIDEQQYNSPFRKK